MVLDNTLWSGRVASPTTRPRPRMFVELNDRIASDPRVVAVVLTVRDGVTLVRLAADQGRTAAFSRSGGGSAKRPATCSRPTWCVTRRSHG